MDSVPEMWRPESCADCKHFDWMDYACNETDEKLEPWDGVGKLCPFPVKPPDPPVIKSNNPKVVELGYELS